MEIKNIIKEEIENLFSKNVRYNFRQQLNNSWFYNYESFSNDYDVEMVESNIFVNWNVDIWIRPNGIENFVVNVESVEGEYGMELHDKQSDEVAQELKKNIAETPWKFTVNDVKLEPNLAFYIERLTFDFASKVCDVDFYDPDKQY